MTTEPKPTWRKPVGVLVMLVALGVYAVIVVNLLEPIATWPVAAQVVAYAVFGTLWILPMGRFLRWMETGRFR